MRESNITGLRDEQSIMFIEDGIAQSFADRAATVGEVEIILIHSLVWFKVSGYIRIGNTGTIKIK